MAICLSVHLPNTTFQGPSNRYAVCRRPNYDVSAITIEVLPNVKTNSWSIEGGRGCHSFALPVDYYRRLIVQRLMQTLVVVKLKIATQAVN